MPENSKPKWKLHTAICICAFVASFVFAGVGLYIEDEEIPHEIYDAVEKYMPPDTMTRVNIYAQVAPSELAPNPRIQLISAKDNLPDMIPLYSEELQEQWSSGFNAVKHYYHSQFGSNLPDLTFEEDYLPIGNSHEYCINLKWASNHDSKTLKHKIVEVGGQTECKQHADPKKLWRDEDPTTGQDFFIFKQHKETPSEDGSCPTDKYMKTDFGGEFCYAYEVLSALCFVISWDDTAQTWEYAGGCFPNGEEGVYEWATPGDEVAFDDLLIEVHQLNRADYASDDAVPEEEKTHIQTLVVEAYVLIGLAWFSLLIAVVYFVFALYGYKERNQFNQFTD